MEEDPFSPGGELCELFKAPYRIDHGLKIDKKLQIDPKHLSFGTKIGGGEHSIVYQGTYKSMSVAIKIILPEESTILNSTWKERFQREVTLHSRTRHENIVKFIGASLQPTLLIIQEFMGGGTLHQFLLNMHPNRPNLETSVSFALQISQAMSYLHGKGIIHRDLKPINMLLSEDKDTVKIIDFGLAREEIVGEMSTEAGTYRWMAPEMFHLEGSGKTKKYDHKVDVYSFSLVLWELLTNQIPFQGRGNLHAAFAAAQNIRPSTDDIPEEIVPLVVSCWAENPEGRPEFIQIKQFLENFLHYLCTAGATPPRIMEIERTDETSAIGDCACTSRLVQNPTRINDKPKSAAGHFRRCFGSCLP